MSKVNRGDTVRLVKAPSKFMQAEPRNIGKGGVVSEVIRDGSLVYYAVTLSNGREEHVEAQALSVTQRARTERRAEKSRAFAMPYGGAHA